MPELRLAALLWTSIYDCSGASEPQKVINFHKWVFFEWRISAKKTGKLKSQQITKQQQEFLEIKLSINFLLLGLWKFWTFKKFSKSNKFPPLFCCNFQCKIFTKSRISKNILISAEGNIYPLGFVPWMAFAPFATFCRCAVP